MAPHRLVAAPRSWPVGARKCWTPIPGALYLAFLLLFFRSDLLGVPGLAEGHVDRVGAVQEWERGGGADAEGGADVEQVFVLGVELESLLRGLDGLLAIAGGVVDAGQVRVVIGVIELQLDRAAAKLDGQLDLLLAHQRDAETEEREAAR